MGPIESGLAALASFLDVRAVPHMVAGDVAGLAWGTARATFSLEVALWAPDREEELVRALLEAFESRTKDAAAFVRKTAVLPLKVGGVRVDVVFGRLPFEERAVRRAREVGWGETRVRVCSPEDLIVRKIISDRPMDQDDIRAVMRARFDEIDRRYLDPIVSQLAAELARPQILKSYLALWSAARPGRS